MADHFSESALNDPRFQPLIESFGKGEVRRRDFLRRAVGLGLKSSAAYALLHSATASAQTATYTSTPGEEVIYHTTSSVGEEAQGPQQGPGQPPQGPIETYTSTPGEEVIQTTTSSVGEEAQGPQQTTMRVGEENATTLRGSVNGAPPEEEQYNPSTRAVGEESNPTTCRGNVRGARPEEEVMSTRAVGEEGGTTAAAGEEGATTKAYGEEGVQDWTPSTRRAGEEQPNATSAMRGEEGNTTKAMGEENSNNPQQLPPGVQLAPGEVLVDPGFSGGVQSGVPIQQALLQPGEVIIDGGSIVPSQSPAPAWNGFRRWKKK